MTNNVTFLLLRRRRAAKTSLKKRKFAFLAHGSVIAMLQRMTLSKLGEISWRPISNFRKRTKTASSITIICISLIVHLVCPAKFCKIISPGYYSRLKRGQTRCLLWKMRKWWTWMAALGPPRYVKSWNKAFSCRSCAVTAKKCTANTWKKCCFKKPVLKFFLPLLKKHSSLIRS